MKRYIKSTEESIHLKDLIDSIEYFVLMDDVDNCNFGEIHASEDTDDEFYTTLPDSRLLELDDATLSNITNIYVLDRLAKLDQSRLTAEQLELLQSVYRQHIVMDDSDREALLEMFKQCNSIYVANRRKNLRFLHRYNLNDQDILNILHNLQLSDFAYRTKSINLNYLGDALVVLNPKIIVPATNRMIGVNLYVKLDIDQSDGSCAAFISLHPEEFNQPNA